MCENGICNRTNLYIQLTYKGYPLAQPNFQFEKRQKELARKKKQEEKKLRKLEERNHLTDENPETPADHSISQ
jgi:hypothetical protein